MKIVVIPVTPFVQNCTLLRCEATGKGAVVDPGGDVDEILRVVEREGTQVEQVLLTHDLVQGAGSHQFREGGADRTVLEKRVLHGHR